MKMDGVMWMLNHKFYFEGAKKDGDGYIRISDALIEKMGKDLIRYKFHWCEYDEPQYGFGSQVLSLGMKEVRQLKECLSRQPETEWEYQKFMGMLDRAIVEGRELMHDSGAPWGPFHDFVICDAFPTKEGMHEDGKRIDYTYFRRKYALIKIPDQFIMENYDVFKHVQLYWSGTVDLGGGFHYYGDTWITTQMAQELLDFMEEYLRGNTSEAAVYFKGREYDILVSILETAIAENKVVIHFGI